MSIKEKLLNPKANPSRDCEQLMLVMYTLKTGPELYRAALLADSVSHSLEIQREIYNMKEISVHDMQVFPASQLN